MKRKFLSIVFLFSFLISLSSCGGKLPGGDARKFPPNPDERVRKNIEEGRGFRLMDNIGKTGSGNFEFSSSNELWRATLDIIDFMPLALANYSGGIIVTDWYSEGNNLNEAIKISVRFLTNEVRSDALDIKIFYKKCSFLESCAVTQQQGVLVAELSKKILTKAAIYKKQSKDKDYKPYIGSVRPKDD